MWMRVASMRAMLLQLVSPEILCMVGFLLSLLFFTSTKYETQTQPQTAHRDPHHHNKLLAGQNILVKYMDSAFSCRVSKGGMKLYTLFCCHFQSLRSHRKMERVCILRLRENHQQCGKKACANKKILIFSFFLFTDKPKAGIGHGNYRNSDYQILPIRIREALRWFPTKKKPPALKFPSFPSFRSTHIACCRYQNSSNKAIAPSAPSFIPLFSLVGDMNENRTKQYKMDEWIL